MTRFLTEAKNFACGQVVSVFSMSALLFAKRLARREVHAPILANLFFYLLLAVAYILYGWRRPSVPSGPAQDTVRWWLYPFLALLDVQANVCAAKSVVYTTFATTGLTLNLAIPFVFVICTCVLKVPSSWKQATGCGLTVIGGLVLLGGCASRFKSDDIEHQELYGWALALISAALYAASNIVNQWCLKIRGMDSMIDCLGMIGAWGAFFCVIETGLIEHADITAINWNSQVSLLFLGYTLALFAFYTAVYVVVHGSETTAYNVSLLFSSVYLMLASYYLLNETIDVYTVVAMVVMLVGLSIYTWSCAVSGSSNLTQSSFDALRAPREDYVLAKIQRVEV
ncbi:hypothetical protein Poli38472_006064 [Pythium oligandrum]|uniref:Drug/Metabolite Transporter (DMT) Superfamily n=1 Tax=Pythium oligandrum TaxID=41045 RepID=A0A8K1FMT2_PYTOL|nr:hypothetical protein Poli38472_006064 [Pythium oligandrum]|eukprot:TMW68596.1 hypothetical protein Poli38472_006064 [Pythium oligandrum]